MSEKVLTAILILGILAAGFFGLDEGLGETTKHQEMLTVTDTYNRHIMSGKVMVIKHYVIVQTETGEEEISVNANVYDKVEKNDEISVTVTITETKWTHQTVISYSID